MPLSASARRRAGAASCSGAHTTFSGSGTKPGSAGLRGGGMIVGMVRAVLLTAGLLAACDASIGQGGGAGTPDAAVGQAPPDAAAPPDAGAPDAALPPPCEGGDDRVQDPDTGACYLYFQAAATWTGAQSACASLGGHLAFIDSADESLLIGQIAPATTGLQDIWVGGTDTPTEGTWRWLASGPIYYQDGVSLEFTNWREGEPNNANGENCMIIEGDDVDPAGGPHWDDRPCDVTYPYMCER